MDVAIDIGGTFTDAVAIDHYGVIKTAKASTTHDNLTVGAIIGKVELVDVKEYQNIAQIKADSKEHLTQNNVLGNKYGFILKNPKQLKVPIPCNGQLNFFDLKPKSVKIDEIKTDIFEEEHRYMWINHH